MPGASREYILRAGGGPLFGCAAECGGLLAVDQGSAGDLWKEEPRRISSRTASAAARRKLHRRGRKFVSRSHARYFDIPPLQRIPGERILCASVSLLLLPAHVQTGSQVGLVAAEMWTVAGPTSS